ncbi:cytidylyltransferase domain-containing protein [Pseudoalteromonas sp. SWXJZ10B]|uniref:cytidylyltransferase domain-containing protein n=1 Tax=Pseudoalteromonas sp. SWXJZ10B TaxID=2792063 RepID=UPI0018CEFEF3|nr:glycosyltransferase family protein [Pseudoalteromonas sp. SWXJZ10B]MBH0042956.1 glycosyltransferase family protein [Pseudoalteromonas sp. SWXJZ10B]
MSKLYIIIQARMTSSRLPGKVLLPFGTNSILETMLDRLINFKSNIIIATTNDGTEAPIINICQKNDIRFYRGDTEDVLGRYFNAAKFFDAKADDVIIRLTSDCPFIDPKWIQTAIGIFEKKQFDIVSLGPHSGFPRGLDTCIFSFSLLEYTSKLATMKADREHVTLGMNKFKNLSVFNLSAEADYSQFRITLDEHDDYKMLCALYEHFNYDPTFSYEQLIYALTTHSDISNINKHVEQKSN